MRAKQNIHLLRCLLAMEIVTTQFSTANPDNTITVNLDMSSAAITGRHLRFTGTRGKTTPGAMVTSIVFSSDIPIQALTCGQVLGCPWDDGHISQA